MLPIPRERIPDSTLSLLRDPYGFISKRCRRHGADLFQTRILLNSTICMTGPGAAELFYDEERFLRAGAMPGPIKKTLLGQGGVQGLDGAAHRHRKAMFLRILGEDRVAELTSKFEECWLRYAERWQSREKVVLFDELHLLLCEAVCDWAGVPLANAEVPLRARQLASLFLDVSSLGPKYLRSRWNRRQANRWIEQIIERIRRRELHPPEDSAAHVVAWHREFEGELLSPQVAAVELLNVLRPTVAVSVFILYAAIALHEYAECRARITNSANDYTEWFVQEVRRYFPFFPALAAQVRCDFDWNNFPFKAGTWVLLDLYGTNHDDRIWQQPDEFRPERFEHGTRGPFSFVPQGGGDYAQHHRCPGEPATIALMKSAVHMLAQRMTYEVPPQKLKLNRRLMPPLPPSRFVMQKVRLLGQHMLRASEEKTLT